MERLDVFMARANALYYATQNPFADFTTAPEITQVFGELLGAWAAIQWQAMGEPNPVLLVEAGPGRGTLMADALRAAALIPAFHAALQVHFIETSPRLRAIQAAAVPRATWHSTLDAVPPGPIILFANEFLDALPIRQFVYRETWAERFVANGAFIERPGPTLPPGQPGDVREQNDAAQAFITAIATRVRHAGTALFLDYGPAHSAPGDSLQALRDGRPTNPLIDPGQADLTAHVDFAALAKTATTAGAATHGPRAQGLFLADLGLFQRTGRLAESQPPARAAALIQSAQRLAEPGRMGRLFQALVVQAPSLPTPPGFT